MPSEEKAAESGGESSSRREKFKEIFALGLLVAVVAGSPWGNFFISTRSADKPHVIFVAIVTFTLTVLISVAAASGARRNDGGRYKITALVVYAFQLITASFATLYWSIGTAANFNVELSRVDAFISRWGH